MWNIIPNTSYISSLNKPQQIKKNINILCIFSDQDSMEVEVNHKKKKSRNTTNIWRLNYMLQKNEWINEEKEEEIKKRTWKQMKMKPQQSTVSGM